MPPRGVLEAETLILDLTGYDSVSIPEGLAPGDGIRVLFNPDSFKKEKFRKSGSCSRSTVWMRTGRW